MTLLLALARALAENDPELLALPVATLPLALCEEVGEAEPHTLAEAEPEPTKLGVTYALAQPVGVVQAEGEGVLLPQADAVAAPLLLSLALALCEAEGAPLPLAAAVALTQPLLLRLLLGEKLDAPLTVPAGDGDVLLLAAVEPLLLRLPLTLPLLHALADGLRLPERVAELQGLPLPLPLVVRVALLHAELLGHAELERLALELRVVREEALELTVVLSQALTLLVVELLSEAAGLELALLLELLQALAVGSALVCVGLVVVDCDSLTLALAQWLAKGESVEAREALPLPVGRAVALAPLKVGGAVALGHRVARAEALAHQLALPERLPLPLALGHTLADAHALPLREAPLLALDDADAAPEAVKEEEPDALREAMDKLAVGDKLSIAVTLLDAVSAAVEEPESVPLLVTQPLALLH